MFFQILRYQKFYTVPVKPNVKKCGRPKSRKVHSDYCKVLTSKGALLRPQEGGGRALFQIMNSDENSNQLFQKSITTLVDVK